MFNQLSDNIAFYLYNKYIYIIVLEETIKEINNRINKNK